MEVPTLLAHQRRRRQVDLENLNKAAVQDSCLLCEDLQHDDPQPAADVGCRLVVRGTFLELSQGGHSLRAKLFRSRNRAKTDSMLEANGEEEEDYCPGAYADTAEARARSNASAGSSSRGSSQLPDDCLEEPQKQQGPESPPKPKCMTAQQLHEHPQLTAAVEKTTVMMRNIPNNYTRDMLLAMLDEEGFFSQYDFIYLPMDFGRRANLGYAFVNLVSEDTAQKFWLVFSGFCRWAVPTAKVCEVTWGGPHQGRQAHIDRYKNSPVMHVSVPDEFKPMIFRNGVRQAFPPSSRKLRPPNKNRD
eukprot:TRINITY_DN77987_c0_g1_i1.p1 TRINITY_DN77987_c0_g1~~TRINITY_DN77987_c0_g1_i1.p1  ORF type:complete len:303 (+),score=48.38 TRINITY_DN77987_c0_g1_i1:77-985(+)